MAFFVTMLIFCIARFSVGNIELYVETFCTSYTNLYMVCLVILLVLYISWITQRLFRGFVNIWAFFYLSNRSQVLKSFTREKTKINVYEVFVIIIGLVFAILNFSCDIATTIGFCFGILFFVGLLCILFSRKFLVATS